MRTDRPALSLEAAAFTDTDAFFVGGPAGGATTAAILQLVNGASL